MFALEDLPCALYFTICDAWLTVCDLNRLDLALTSLERREKYLSILSYSKVLTHHSFVATHHSLAWMSKRSLSCSELILSIRDLFLLTSKHCPFPIATHQITSLHIMCTDYPMGQTLKSLGEALKEFPKLSKLSMRGHYLPCNSNAYVEKFHNDILCICFYCPLLRTLKIFHNELLSDDMVSLVCHHLPKLRKLYLSGCPLLTTNVLAVVGGWEAGAGVTHRGSSKRGSKGGIGGGLRLGMPPLPSKSRCKLTNFTWHCIEPIRLAAGASIGTHGATGKGGSSLTHISLLGPGFTREMVVGLVHNSPHLHALTCTYSDVLTEHDIESIVTRYARQLSSLSLMKMGAVSDHLFHLLHHHGDPLLLQGLRLHCEGGTAGAVGNHMGGMQAMPPIQHMALEPPTPSTTAASTPSSSTPSTPNTPNTPGTPLSLPLTPNPSSPSVLISHFAPLTLNPPPVLPPSLALPTPVTTPVMSFTPIQTPTPTVIDPLPTLATLEMFFSKFGHTLSSFQLSGSYVTDEMVALIARYCSGVMHLYLYGNDALTDASLQFLLESPYGVGGDGVKRCVYISRTLHMSDDVAEAMDTTFGERLVWV